jgi:hypothetical protein
MLRNQEQCLPDGINFQMAGHSKGGQGVKRALAPQKEGIGEGHGCATVAEANVLKLDTAAFSGGISK